MFIIYSEFSSGYHACIMRNSFKVSANFLTGFTVKEKDVKKQVREDLQEKFDFVKEEFPFSEGRVDLVGFRWKEGDPYHIDCVSVECKGEIKYPKQIYGLLSEQLARYLKVLPNVYLASSKPKSQDVLDAVKVLCKLNNLGYITVEEEVKYELSIEGPWTAMLDGDRYVNEIRTKAAMFLTFQDVFGKDSRLGPTWCSTPEPNDKVQYNAWQRQDECRLGVNIENAGKVIGRFDAAYLHKLIKQESLGAVSLIHIWHERYHGPGQRTGITLFQKLTEEIRSDDLIYIKKKASDGARLHMGISTLVWKNEVLSRDEHKKRMELAKELLKPLHDYLSSLH